MGKRLANFLLKIFHVHNDQNLIFVFFGNKNLSLLVGGQH